MLVTFLKTTFTATSARCLIKQQCTIVPGGHIKLTTIIFTHRSTWTWNSDSFFNHFWAPRTCLTLRYVLEIALSSPVRVYSRPINLEQSSSYSIRRCVEIAERTPEGTWRSFLWTWRQVAANQGERGREGKMEAPGREEASSKRKHGELEKLK